MLYEVITIATAPNQVWCWDITWLKTDIRGIFYYAYVITDIYDRAIVGWEIHDREESELARITSYNVCYTKLLRDRFVEDRSEAEHILSVRCSKKLRDIKYQLNSII